jgi:hypothetical protein
MGIHVCVRVVQVMVRDDGDTGVWADGDKRR